MLKIIMKKMKRTLIFIFIINAYSCAPSYYVDPGAHTDYLSAKNYREQLSIVKLNYIFSKGKYIGKEKDDCFPPITSEICEKEQAYGKYEALNSLKIEKYEISIHSFDKTNNLKLIEDLLLLTAADLALQAGFSFLTMTKKGKVTACQSNYSLNTDGSNTFDTNTYGANTSGGGTFNGNTTVRKVSKCANMFQGEFFVLHSVDDLKGGVFQRYRDKSSVLPVLDLYYGTSPNIGYEDVSYSSHHRDNDSVTYLSHTPIKNAWRNVYDASGLSRDLREKYGITKKEPYVYKDFFSDPQTKNTEDDIIKKNRVPIY